MQGCVLVLPAAATLGVVLCLQTFYLSPDLRGYSHPLKSLSQLSAMAGHRAIYTCLPSWLPSGSASSIPGCELRNTIWLL